MESGARRRQEIRSRIDELHGAIGARQRELLRLVREYDSDEHYGVDGCRDMAQWLSGRLGVRKWDARRWVEAAHALEQLPLVSEALETGTLSIDKVSELARFATVETEANLIPWARRVSARCLREHGDRFVTPATEAVEEAETGRKLRWWYYDDGASMGLEGRFPTAEGAAIVKAITRAAERLDQLAIALPEGLDPSMDDLFEKRCADALWALCSQAIAADQDPDRATVVVHTVIDADGTRRSSEIEGASVISETIARRLECDARLQFVLTDKQGNALGIGRAHREPPAWLARQVRWRDHGCTFPGCGTTAWLHNHHIWHWTDGGPTDLDNLVLACHFHHKLLHEGNWSVRLVGNEAHWYKPSGMRYDPGPDPPLDARAAA